jgi:pantetheine-phosphate adenylyltransferase
LNSQPSSQATGLTKKAIYPGSFDPITNGHLDILDRALHIFPEITIVVAGTGQKDPLFTPDERVELIQEVVKNRGYRPGSVKVDRWTGLIMEYARTHEVSAVIRGLRAASDFEYEFMMASMNKQINHEVETLFMMTAQNLYFVSSSMVKELARYGGEISQYVSKEVVAAVAKKRDQLSTAPKGGRGK